MSLCRITRGIYFASVAVLLGGGLASSSGLRMTALPALQVAPGLVAHWELNSILSPQNDVGGTHPITLVGGPVAAPGVFGGAVDLDGTNDLLDAADANDLDFGAGDFTIALWCRPDDTGDARLINKWDGPAQQGWLLDIHSGTGGGATVGSIRLRLDTNAAANTANVDTYEFAIPAALDSGNWRHIAATIDRTGRTARIFMDGVQVGATQNIPATFVGSVSNTFSVGVGSIPTAATAAKFLNGAVDDIKLYNRNLSSQEVNALYNNGFIAIGVGNAGPVVPQRGLLGTYYNYPVNSATPPGNPPGSPDTTPATQAGTVQFLQRIDRVIDLNFQTTVPPGSASGSDWFMVAWEGSIVVPAAGDYRFFVSSDDGERSWFGNPTSATPDLEFWVQRGVATDSFPTAGTTALVAGNLGTRLEFEQGNGGAVMRLEWTGPPVSAQRVIQSIYLTPPAGPPAPAGLNAVATINSPTPQITVTWGAATAPPIDATSYILSRATTPGGPYTQVAVQAGTNFTDNNVTFGTTYYYVVQGTAANGLRVGPTSAETPGVTPAPPALSVTATVPLITSEAGINDGFTLTVNTPPSGSAVNVVITSSDATEATLSGNGPGQALQTGSPITIIIPDGTAAGTNIPITVVGENDFIADGTQNYTITFVVTGGGVPYAGLTIAPIAGSNSDNDTPGITVTQLSGPTDENGGTATFVVVFNTQPSVNTTVNVTSGNTAEATVSPASLTFSSTLAAPDPQGWNTNHVVTVTGADDLLLDFTQPFSINLTVAAGGDPTYVAMTAGGPIVRSGVNIDNETIPTLEPVWGGGGGGGCGLTGFDAGLLVLALAALRRRRRSSP